MGAMGEQKTLVVIDGKSVLYRGYYAMGNLATPQGRSTGASYGFAMMGLRILKEFDPDYIVVAWDKSKTNIRARQQRYAEYKANRQPMPQDLREQIDDVRALCDAFGWPLLEIDDFEADDIMGTLAVQAKEKGIDSILVTSDLDVLQLVNHHTKTCALKRGLTQTVLYDEATFEDEFGMSPQQFVDYKALRGDPSDNIPGVKGVGDKTARKLIQEYGSLEKIYESLDDIGGAAATKLREDQDMAFLSRDLVTLSLEVPIEFDEVAANAHVADPAAVKQLFDELNFRRLTQDLPAWMQSEQQLFDQQSAAVTAPDTADIKITTIQSARDLLELPDSKTLMVFASLDQGQEPPVVTELLLSPSQDEVYRWPQPQAVSETEEMFRRRTVAGYDLKPLLRGLKLPEPSGWWDMKIAEFLLDPLQRLETLAEVLEHKYGYNLVIGGEEPLSEESLKRLVPALWQLQHDQAAAFEHTPKLQEILQTIEMPLLPVIARMEDCGIKLNTQYLKTMSDDFAGRIGQLQADIYQEAGQEFNINSPQQLQAVLFDTLQLSTADIKKTKTGYSTGASELEKLRGLHPIIDKISHYRELTKLKSTYIDALPKLVAEDGRLHTTFTQTVAQTGRLSSLHPNLQNIPVRTEEGRAIRQAFVAEDGNALVQADYSQFELRLAAALSGDEHMLAAFNAGEDIHTKTAAELYGIEQSDVTKEQRYNAKAVNFGVMYGMSAHGLSVATSMSREEAAQFIATYFQLRPKLWEYLEGLKHQAKTDGYVETMFGRRRPMPDIHATNFAVRAAAERAAMNMPIQGTEADLMKLAMIQIDRQLSDQAWQILQIHDSIIVECSQEEASSVAKILQEIMEGVAEDLPVKLEVDTAIGSHWGEL